MPFSPTNAFVDYALKPLPTPPDGVVGDFNIFNNLPPAYGYANAYPAYHYYQLNSNNNVNIGLGVMSKLEQLPQAGGPNVASYLGTRKTYLSNSTTALSVYNNDYSNMMHLLFRLMAFGVYTGPANEQRTSVSYVENSSTMKYLDFTFMIQVVDGAKTRQFNKVMTTADYGLILDVTPLPDTPVNPHLFKAVAMQLNYWASLGTSFNPPQVDANKVFNTTLDSTFMMELMQLGSLLTGKCGCNSRCVQANYSGCCNGQCCNGNWICCASQCCNSNNSCSCNTNLTCTQYNRKANFNDNTIVGM